MIQSNVKRLMTATKLAAAIGATMLSVSAMAQTTNPATAPARGGGGGGGGRGPANPNNTNYQTRYGLVTAEQIASVMDRVFNFIDANTASQIISRGNGAPVTDFTKPVPDAAFEQKPYSIVSYEWGVTYSGLLELADATGDAKYKKYVDQRLNVLNNALKLGALAAAAPATAPAPAGEGAGPGGQGRGGRGGGRGGLNLRGMTAPASLDDSGSMCAALIKARANGAGPDMMEQINRYITWVHTGQQRLSDGTLSRNRPHTNTLWLDDLYMSVPALAHMGKLTGDKKYYDDACKQILQFGKRMFNTENNGLWAHGWAEHSPDFPVFHWGRANGWAALSLTELLTVLPEDHPQRAEVMKVYKTFMKGLAKHQSSSGMWYQILDRQDSYLESSCTAMFVYAMARGVDKGWLDPFAFGPVAILGWNGLTGYVNERGQIENVCIATDLGADYAFYYGRPYNVSASHGFGPVLLAGAEMTRMIKSKTFVNSFGSVQYSEPGYVSPFGNRGGRGGGGGGGGRGDGAGRGAN